MNVIKATAYDKENIEEQIETMLEKVLKDENDEDCDSQHHTLYTMMNLADKDELPSFMQEEDNRREKKSLTFNLDTMVMYPQMINYDKRRSSPQKVIQSVERNSKRPKTHAYNFGLSEKLKFCNSDLNLTHCFTNSNDDSSNANKNSDNRSFNINQNSHGSAENDNIMNSNQRSKSRFIDIQNSQSFNNMNPDTDYFPSNFQNFANNQNQSNNMSNNNNFLNDIKFQNHEYNNQQINQYKDNLHNGSNGSNLSNLSNGNNLIGKMKDIESYLESTMKNLEKIDEESYKKMRGMFFSILTCHKGSVILQKTIKKTHKDILSLILDEIIEGVHYLMVDPYANYFCQKFFQSLKTSDKVRFLTWISPYISDISKSKIGTYPLQSFIEYMSIFEEKVVVLEAIRPHVFELCLDTQGVHVIEKIIQCFEEDLVGYIYDVIIDNFSFIANNCNGLCVAKKIIVHSNNPVTITKILKKIIENGINLVQNSFGNYVIQAALDYWNDEYLQHIYKIFFGKLGNLSMQKYSSNVIEKCLLKGGEFVINNFIDEITCNQRVVDLMKNNYGNFVVQKTLKLSNGKHKLKLLKLMIKNIEKIGDRKLIFKWKSIIESHIYPENSSIDSKSSSFIEMNNLNNMNNFNMNNFNNLNLNANSNLQQMNKSMLPICPQNTNLNLSYGVPYHQGLEQNFFNQMNLGNHSENFCSRGSAMRHTTSFQPDFKKDNSLNFDNINFSIDDMNCVNNRILFKNFEMNLNYNNKDKSFNGKNFNNQIWGGNNPNC